MANKIDDSGLAQEIQEALKRNGIGVPKAETEEEIVELIKNSFDKRAIYVPGVFIYYQESIDDRREIYIDQDKKEQVWKIIHNSKVIKCVDENMQSFLSLNEENL